jgi:hypothetical protein
MLTLRGISSAPAFRQADGLDFVATFIAVALVTVIACGDLQSLRMLLALFFTFFVPGRAIVSNWPRVRRSSAVGMPILFSLGSVTLIATVSLWMGFWHPMALFAIEATTSLAGLGIGVARRHRQVPTEETVDVKSCTTRRQP